MSLNGAPEPRHVSVAVNVGGVTVGGGAPIVVQSMTNTDTADVDGTVEQVAALARAGSEIVRITVDRDEAAAAVPHIKERLLKMGVTTRRSSATSIISATSCSPIIRPAPRRSTNTASIPAMSASRTRRTGNSRAIVETAIKHGKPVRIGANWGSLDQELAHASDGRERQEREADRGARGDARGDGAVGAALRRSAPRRSGLAKNRIILSAKVSAVQDLIAVYADLARRSDYAIHLGLTEAGMGSKGIVASSAALGILLQHGIGDTIRISLTPEPGGDRTVEVKVAQEILQTMGFRVFVPLVAACPGCGRTTSTTFQELARDIQAFHPRTRCRSGRSAIPASRRSMSRSWAAS